MKQYLGIDVAKHEHVLGSRYESGERHGGAFAFANDENGFESLLERLRELGAEPEESLVVMESTGHYWMALWEFLVAHGYEVAIVNPVLTDAFRKADTLRKTKTDRVDAFLIAEYARFKGLGPTRVSPVGAEGLKQLTRYRHHLVSERTALKNRLTSVADRGLRDSRPPRRSCVRRHAVGRALSAACILYVSYVLYVGYVVGHRRERVARRRRLLEEVSRGVGSGHLGSCSCRKSSLSRASLGSEERRKSRISQDGRGRRLGNPTSPTFPASPSRLSRYFQAGGSESALRSDRVLLFRAGSECCRTIFADAPRLNQLLAEAGKA